MLRRMRAGRLEQFEGTDQVALEIAARIVDRIAHPGLRCEMDNHIRGEFISDAVEQILIFEHPFSRGKIWALK